MNISKSIFDSLPIDIKDSLITVNKSKEKYDKNPDDIFLKIDFKEKIYDLSLSCKWHRIEGDLSIDFLDELEDYYWRCL